MTWGYAGNGGSTTSPVNAAANLTSGVTLIFSTWDAFAALKADGSVVTWGNADHGGSTAIQTPLGDNLSSGVTQIFSAGWAFAALKADGSVVTWGDAGFGGSTTSPVDAAASLTSGVTQIFSAFYAFAALKADGSVVTWGRAESGGSTTETPPTGGTLTSGVTQIFSNEDAFAALKADGSVVTWGSAGDGGSTTTPAPTGGTLSSGVTQIFSTDYAFAALKADGSVVTWGYGGYGGSTTTPVDAAASLTSGVETIASPLFRPAYLPGAPTQAAVAQPAAGDSTVVVSFLAPGANGGTPITGYRATCSSSTGAGEAEATTSSTDSLRISVEGLTLGATYTCAVRARNIVGDGQPSAASNSLITSASAVAKKVPLLRSSLTCRKTGVRTTCTTRGPVPPGATAVTQRATTSAARASQSSEMARPTVKTAKAACRITKRGKGKKATRTYQCTIRLSKGKWTITTKALKKTTVIAQSVKTKKVK